MSTPNLLEEEVITLSEARRNLIPRRNGKCISPSQLWRWIHRGLKTPDGTRVRLEVCYVGNSPMVSREAIARFFQRLTEARLAGNDATDNPPQRSAEMEQRLRGEGLYPA